MSRPFVHSSSFEGEISRSIQYITDNLLVTALPRKQVFDSKEESSPRHEQQQQHKAGNALQQPRDDIQQEDVFFRQRIEHLDYFLQHQQSVLGSNTQFVLVSLAADPPAPELLQVMQQQVITLPWQATGAPASELPTLECLLRICYAVQALMNWTPASAVRVILACENGQTKSGLAVAALLRYMDNVPCTRDGFLHFVVRTILQHQAVPNPLPIYESLPASVRTLLRNWDQIMEWKAWLQPKPLWLRAITIQGIPVEDQPCVDVYDATGRHVYSSHAWLWEEFQDGGDNVEDINSDDNANDNIVNTNSRAEQDEDPSLALSHVSGLTGGSTSQQPNLSQKQKVQRQRQASAMSPWVDDEGFFKVNQWVAGDFCVLCRFGGPHAIAENVVGPPTGDTTKLLFRYANATTVLPGGILECPMPQVDIMERYQPFLDPHDFLLTLVWESSWEKHSAASSMLDWAPPPLVFGHEALSEGCAVLSEFHALQPPHESVEVPVGCTPNIWTLLWQLSAGDQDLTLERWQLLVLRFEAEEALRARSLASSRKGHAPADPNHVQSVLHILDGLEVDDGRDCEPESKISAKESTAAKADETAETIKDGSPASHCGRHHHRFHHRGSLQWRSAILQANAGDIPVALGLRGHAFDWVHTVQHSESIPPPTAQPRLPLLPLRQTERLPALEPLDDPVNTSAVELYLKIAHAGVALEDLQELAKAEMDVMPVREVKEEEKEVEEPVVADVEQGNPNEARYIEVENKAENKDEPDPVSEEAEASKDDKEAAPEPQEEDKDTEPEPHEEHEADGNPPMKKDKRFQKYWKMKAVGLPEDAIKHAMQKDGVEVSMWDLDWEKNYEEQTEVDSGENGESMKGKVPMKKDPRFEKYWKMKSVGLPADAIKHAMQKDSVDVSVWDLDWEKNYEDQTETGGGDDGGGDKVPMKKDPRFEKYWKMKSVGLPDGAIQNSMARDNVDASVLQLDWEKNYEEQTSPPPVESIGPPMKNDPRFEKYWKMKSVGLPDGAILNAMARDDIDRSVLNLDWERNYEEQTVPSGGAVDGPPMKEDPRFEKYWKMKSVGLPDGAILNAMARDDVDGSILGLDWEKNYEAQTAPTGGCAEESPPMKNDPKFKKYWKMKTVGLPEGAIRNAMTKDGLDPSLFDLDWEKSLASQQGGQPPPDTGPPLKDDPEFTKYFRMLSMGLPPGAVKNAMSKDGKDPGIIDLDPSRPLASQVKTPAPRAPKRASIVPKKLVRRKKIFWKPLDPEQIKENSLWSLVKGKVSMSHLNYDVKEFEDLFTESADPVDKAKKKKAKESAAPAKKAVQVIDGKRSMNGGIILLRLKMDYGKIADLVDDMEQGRLDATQMMGLKEFLPTPDEIAGLEAYMGKCKTEEETTKAYADLSECEKYMWTMKRVGNAGNKIDCMLFKAQFRTRVEELVASMRVIEKACDEVKTSESLHKVLATILTLVNTINTGGEGQGKGVAQGFNLDALLKLNEAKAFDKKTSVLQYLVKLVRHNDETLLGFHKEIKHVNEAQNLMMDMLEGDIKKLSEDLEAIRDTVTQAAENAEATGERKFTLDDLKEQKTLVRRNGSIVQFNKVDHLTGRTPMERFFLRASNDLGALLAMSEEIRAKYENVLEFFGEDSQMPSNEFFGTMYRFIQEFIVSEKQVEKEERARQKEKRRNEAKAKADKAKAMGNNNPITSGCATFETTRNGDTVQKTPVTPEKDASADAHPLVAMLAARQGDNGKSTKGSKKPNAKKAPSSGHPLAALLAARQAPEAAQNNAEPFESSAHPLAAMLASRQQPEEKKADASEPTSTAEESLSQPPSIAHPVAAMLASRLQPEEKKADVPELTSAADASSTTRQQPEKNGSAPEPTSTVEASSTTQPLAPMSANRQEDTAKCSSDDQKNEVAMSAHPLAAMLAERNGRLDFPPEVAKVAPSPSSDSAPDVMKATPVVDGDDEANEEASQSTVEEASALIAAEKEKGKEESKPEPQILSDGTSGEPTNVSLDAAPITPIIAKSVEDVLAATPQEQVTTTDGQAESDKASAWLAAVMEVTGWDNRRAAPKPAQRSTSDESIPVAWVSRRQSMSMG